LAKIGYEEKAAYRHGARTVADNSTKARYVFDKQENYRSLNLFFVGT
jgi:hypothetical protein